MEQSLNRIKRVSMKKGSWVWGVRQSPREVREAFAQKRAAAETEISY